MNRIWSKLPVAIIKIALILLVSAVAAGLRWRAVELLPVDYDEDDYLRAGQQFATALRAGDLAAFTRENYRSEHPPLTKIVYGLALLTTPPFPEIPGRPVSDAPDKSLPRQPLLAARSASAAFGVLSVTLLAIISPLAAVFLAAHTFTIKYTSQVMLEGLPAFTSLAVIAVYLLYLRSPRGSRRRAVWLALCAVCLGLTAAAKYTYALTGVVALMHLLWSSRPVQLTLQTAWKWLRPALLIGLGALAIFLAANPFLWPDPAGRLWQSIVYHGGYAQSQQVRAAALPFWSPISWLATSVPSHPGVFLVQGDLIVLLLACFGLRRARLHHPIFLLWLAFGLCFLLLWPTKWPQYILLITAPLAVVAADGFIQTVYEPSARWLRGLSLRWPRLNRRREFLLGKLKPALPWLLPGLIALAVITVYPLIFQLAIALTDFQSTAIRDGINGGVWREVWMGLTRQVEPRQMTIFEMSASGRGVHYTGPLTLISALFSLGDLYVLEVVWTVLAVVTQTGLGVAVALLLHRRSVKMKGFWQTLFILPWAIPEFVAVLAWAQIFEPRFGYLSLAGRTWSQTPPFVTQLSASWLHNPDLALLVLLIIGLWYGFPIMMLSARAGLKLINAEIYDAAALEGAAGLPLFRYITWPLILPLLLPAIIIRGIYAFNQFYLFIMLDHPLYTLSSLSFFVFSDGNYASAAALNIVTILILVVLVGRFNRWSRAGEGVSYA